MENIEKEIELVFNKNYTEEQFQEIKNKIVKLKGITAISSNEEKLNVCYNPYLVSEAYLLKETGKLGLKTFGETKKGSKISRWLKNMAEANKKNLGSKPLDCCELKSKQN